MKNDRVMVLTRHLTQKPPRRCQAALQHLQQDLIPRSKLLRSRFLHEVKEFFSSVYVDLLNGGRERNTTQAVTQTAETVNRGSEVIRT